MVVDNLHIGIAGAGIAGLVSGLELQRAGHTVSIFEARSRTGGRIQSISLDGMVAECGPEFIHGKLTETISLLKKYNISYDSINGKTYSAKGGKLRATYDIVEGWDQLLGKMKSLQNDLPFHVFLEEYFSGDQFSELKKSASRFAEGFDLADTETASTEALILEWEHEESERYRIPAGYGTLTQELENEFINGGGRIFLNHPIETVNWNSDKIILAVKGDRKFNMDKLVVSLPLSVLNHSTAESESIVFLPSIIEKQAAFNQIGFGTVIKIILTWERAFWKKLIPDAQFIFSDHFIPTWWTQYPLDLPMLTGWIGGPKAMQFAHETDTFFRDKAVESLASIFSLTNEEIETGLKECRIFNWKNEPWSRGAYSYSKVGFRSAKAVCRESLQYRIYFSGEAYYEGPFPGTVEAAIVNALYTAKRILSDLKA